MSADKTEDPASSSVEACRREPSAGEAISFIDDLPVAGPLEELRATFEKKVRMHAQLAEEDAVDQVERAYELARARLEAVLAAPGRPAPACPAATGQRDAPAGS